MLLNEIFAKPQPGFDNQAEDQSIPKLHDVRKTRLTLAQINSLRLMNDIRKFEKESKIEEIQRQYGQPSE
jgi:hypothetical protein